MLQVNMTAAVRNKFGKGAARQLRIEGRTPAVLYGPKTEPLSLSLDTTSFTRELMTIHGQNAIVSLDIEGLSDGAKRSVVIKEIQKDPVHDTLVHADFLEVSLDKPVTLAVPVRYTGKAKGVDMGGFLHIGVQSVHLKGLPLDIPDFIEIDVTELTLGGAGLTCGDLAVPGAVAMQEALDKVCVAVVSPTGKAAGQAEGAEAASA